jgi:hypothetical protein
MKDLRFNFKDYFMVKMELVDVQESTTQAEVTFRQLAIRKNDNTMYPTEEVSTLLKSESGVWTYEKGVVVRPPVEISQVMMESWPELMGMQLLPNADDETILNYQEK